MTVDPDPTCAIDRRLLVDAMQERISDRPASEQARMAAELARCLERLLGDPYRETSIDDARRTLARWKVWSA